MFTIQMKKKLLSLILFAVFGCSLFAQNKSVVLMVASETSSGLTADEISLERMALDNFKVNLTRHDDVRLLSTDPNLLQIKKQAQIDYMKGLLSEDNVYSLDKGEKASLLLTFYMKKSGGKYSLYCNMTNIETKVERSVNTGKITSSEVDETGVDSLSYDVLKTLVKDGYISSISYDLENRLLHKTDSDTNFTQYISQLNAQISSQDRELERLKEEAEQASLSLEEQRRMYELEAKLKILEKDRELALAEQKRAEEAANKEALLQAEKEKMTEEERREYEKAVLALNAKAEAIRKENYNMVSLKTRIELIESDRAVLKELESSVNSSSKKQEEYYKKLIDEAIAEIDNRPYAPGELSNGKPIANAKKFRQMEKDEVTAKYEAELKSVQSTISGDREKLVNDYRERIKKEEKELSGTKFGFRSIDQSQNYLKFSVDAYDGSACSWTIRNSFDVDDIKSIKAKSIKLPSVTIPYKKISGKEPVKNLTKENKKDYEAYIKDTTRADSYFRTGSPYLYSEIVVSVQVLDEKYNLIFEEFSIYKIDTNEKIASLSKNQMASGVITSSANEESSGNSNDEDFSNWNGWNVYTETTEKDREYSVNVNASNLFTHQNRNGFYFDIGVIAMPNSFTGTNLDFGIFGGSSIFYGGIEVSVPIFSYNKDRRSDDDYNGLLFSCLSGVSFRIGFIRPFAHLGIGAASIYSTDGGKEYFHEKVYSGLMFECATGCDLVFIDDYTSIGFIYKRRYLAKVGWTDSYSLSCGLTF